MDDSETAEKKRQRGFDENDLLEAIFFQRATRPMPSTSVLVALPSSSKKRKGVMPLLEKFMDKDYIVKNLEDPIDEGKLEKDDDRRRIPTMDDTSKSTLTKGQHERYIKLEGERKLLPPLHPRQREYRKLQSLVKTEQAVYRKARQDFFIQNVHRFLTGFRPVGILNNCIDYVNWHSLHSLAFIKEWKRCEFPLKFGTVTQEVSLSASTPSSKNDSYPSESKHWTPLKNFHSEVILGLPLERKDLMYQHIFLKDSLPIRIPQKMKQPDVPCFIKNDEIALDLAKQHECSAILSAETLEEILTQKSWKIPLWNISGIRMLDHSLPQPMLPRECLTRGIRNTLRSEKSGKKNIYTLLTMQSDDSKKQYKILVQSPSTTKANKHVNLEYFPERGFETLAPQDQCLWILSTLLAPQSPIELIRVSVEENTMDWNITSCESISVAHALANSNEIHRLLWNRLLVVFNFVVDRKRLPTSGDYLLVYQSSASGDMMSLHRADEDESAIDLESHFQSADTVLTSTTALLECARPWKWESPHRIIDTFPLKDHE